MASSQSFLEMLSVTKKFGGTEAVVDCDLAIQSGEFITLLGPSGCGKTTTLRLIAGFLRPDAGELRLNGALLSSNAVHIPPERRNMGMVFQSFAVWPHMTVFDNVALPLRIRRIGKRQIEARCAEILALCRLEGFEGRDPHQLSGGQLQRVALARALVYRPEVLLLDEPLSNLDASLREEVRRELHTIHNVIKTTFVFVTHDQVEAMSLSDRVVVMNHGRIEQIGSPQDIYQCPETDFVAQFVGAANLLKGEILADSQDADKSLCRLRIEGIELTALRRDSARNGATATVAIHPEAIQLAPVDGAASGANCFHGTICDVYFLGRTQEIHLEVEGVGLRVVQVRGRSFPVGETVSVSIPPSSVLLF